MTNKTRRFLSRVTRSSTEDGAHVPGSPFTSYNQLVVTDTVTKGGPVPDYKGKIARGEYAGTPLSGRRYKVDGHDFSCNHTAHKRIPPLLPWIYGDNRVSGRVQAGFFTNGGNITVTTADNRAKVKFMRELREAQTSFQGGVFLGELRETLRALRNPAKALRDGVSDYFRTLKKRRGTVRGPAHRRGRALRDILSNTWLEYAFGWKPLVSDIDDAAKTLANHLVREDKATRQKVYAVGVTEWVAPTQAHTTVASQGPARVLTRAKDQEEYSVRYFGMVNVEHPYKIGWERVGLDLSNFLPTAWELVPWSFLVDYFTNIGDIISAATYCRSNILWMMRTQRYTATRTLVDWKMPDLISPVGQFYFRQHLSSGKEVWSFTDVSRDKYIGSLVPSLEFEIPGFGTKWINMAALAASSKRLRPYY